MNAQATIDQLEHLVASKKLGKVYVFDGPELWLKENLVQKIIASLLPKESQDLNLNRYHADTLNAGEVISSALCFPFLAEKRVVVVYEAQDLSSSDQKTIGDGISSLPDSTCLIFLWDGKASMKEDVPAQVASHGSIITFWTPFENQLPGWVTQQVKKRGKNITFQAAQRLADTGSDLQEISHEIEKVLLYAGQKNTIGIEELDVIGLPDASGDFKDLENAIWERNLTSTLNEVQLLSRMGVRPEAILPVFERIVRTLLLAHDEAAKKKTPFLDLCANFNIRGRTRQDLFRKGMTSYTMPELTHGLEQIVQTDYENKTGQLPGEISLTLFALGLLKKGKGPALLREFGELRRH